MRSDLLRLTWKVQVELPLTALRHPLALWLALQVPSPQRENGRYSVSLSSQRMSADTQVGDRLKKQQEPRVHTRAGLCRVLGVSRVRGHGLGGARDKRPAVQGCGPYKPR